MKNYGYALIVIISVIVAAPSFAVIIPDEADFMHDAHYYDKYFKKELNFTLQGTSLMVRFEPCAVNTQRASIEQAYGLDLLHEVNPYYHHAMYRPACNPNIPELCSRISAEKGVLSAFPVLIGPDGYEKPVIGHELTVRFVRGLDPLSCQKIIRNLGSLITEDHWTPGYYTVTVPDGMTLFEAIRAYNAMDSVMFAEFSLISFNDKLMIPNDPQFANQQNLSNTGQVTSCICPPYNTHDIRAVDAWDITTGAPDVIVVILDTGADLSHPDLVDNFLPRGSEDWDFADPSDSVPQDDDGHGTSCSGIAAGVTDNGLGIAGIAHVCRIMPLRLDLTTGQNQNRADAINYAASQRPLHQGMVLSNSWRMGSGSFTAVYEAIENAKHTGCVVCFAAGNFDSSPVTVPSDSPHCISVIALSPCDERKSTTSCDGENYWGSSYGADADVSAPGVLIHTTSLGGGYTETFNGTSSACPHVAGACALILSMDPTLTPDDVQSILQDGCDDLGAAGFDDQTGYGRINLVNSLSLVQGVRLDRMAYRCIDTATIHVRDMNAGGSVTVGLTSSTESSEELVDLPETADPGNFEGSINLTQNPPQAGDGLLSIADGDVITVFYHDIPDTDSAIVDCISPVISNVNVTQIGPDTATINWTTDEESDSRVFFGTGNPDQETYDSAFTQTHSILLEDLSECTTYNFYVESSDPAGNTTSEDNGGQFFIFTTWELVIFLNEPMNTDPSWSISGGQWAFGTPAGSGGDPSSGYTGSNIYGYNLSGTYPNSIPAYYLTTPDLDCSQTTQVSLGFYRWLGVESSSYDHAVLSVSNNNGSTWTTVWQNSSTMQDTAWTYVEYDISSFAAGFNQVRIRWQMGPTDSSVTYSGWNIDDVSVFFSQPCGSTPTPSTMTPTATATAVPSFTPTVTPTTIPSATPSHTRTPTSTPTISPTPTPQNTQTHTPTPVPTSSPTGTPTVTAVSTRTPTNTPAHPEPTETGTPTSIPATPTPACTITGVSIWMPGHHYQAGDPCSLIVLVCNQEGYTLERNPLFVLLAIAGQYFFAPGWTNDFDAYQLAFEVGLNEIQVLQEFEWPENAGEGSGVQFISAMTDPGITSIVGEWDVWEFSWGQ